AQRSDALFGQDTDVDSYYGYAGQEAWMNWKYLGERDVLGVYHAQHNPVKRNDPTDCAFDDVWEKRHVYVVEGISKLPQYAFGKRVIFIDKETVTVPFSDIYDRSGELWKIWINDWSFRKKAFDGAGVVEYEDEMGFQPAIVMVDMQLERATKAARARTDSPATSSSRMPSASASSGVPLRARSTRRRATAGASSAVTTVMAARG